MRVRARKFILAATVALVVLVAVPAGAAAGNGGICAGCPPAGGGGGDEAGEVLSLAELRSLTRRIGFAKPRVAAAIAMAESAGDSQAIGRNRRPRSTDRGLFQINSRWHAEVSDRCAFVARCNAREAFRISDGGRDWRQWSTWHNEAYEAYL
jgi:hypothetical protein